MNKKLLISLLLSSTITLGSTLPAYAQVETNPITEDHNQIGYRNLDNYYSLELLWMNGYPISNNIIYKCTKMIPDMIGNGKMFFYEVYAKNVSSPIGYIRITTGYGHQFVEGTSVSKIKEFDVLISAGYPINNSIDYTCTSNNGQTYSFDIFTDGIKVPVGHVNITKDKLGHVLIDGISADEVKKISETNWAEKIKVSENDAIYYTRYAVYSKTFKDVRENEVKIQSLSLMNVNNNLLPCYSLKVNLENSSEQWNVLINAENGETVKVEKVVLD